MSEMCHHHCVMLAMMAQRAATKVALCVTVWLFAPEAPKAGEATPLTGSWCGSASTYLSDSLTETLCKHKGNAPPHIDLETHTALSLACGFLRRCRLSDSCRFSCMGIHPPLPPSMQVGLYLLNQTFGPPSSRPPSRAGPAETNFRTNKHIAYIGGTPINLHLRV